MRKETQQTYKERVLRVLVYIQTHLDHALPLEELARLAHFSPHHFHRVFRGMVGEPVKEHVRRLRLERAAHRLKVSTQPVTRIAFEAGFEAHESFTRAFGTMFGQSPSEFRQAHRVPPLRPAPSGVHFVPGGELEDFQTLEDTNMKIDFVKLSQIKVAFVRHVGPYDQCVTAWEKLCAWAGPRGLLGPNMTMFGMCHDDPEVTPAEKIRYDACLIIGDGATAEGEVGMQEVAAGEYAVVRHRGPYEKLGETYAQLCGPALASAGREPAPGPSLEFYRNNPKDTAPEDLITDVHMPVIAQQ